MKKYELTGETKEVYGHILHRIRALRDFGDFRKGTLGGWVERERNLSQTGNAWVSDNAEVYGDAKVYGNAWVSDNAEVYGDAKVYGNAWVYDNAKVSDNAEVYGNALVSGNAEVFGNAEVYGDAWVGDNARVYGDAWVGDNARVYGVAWVSGNATVCGKADVCGDAHIVTNADYTVYKNTWSSGRWFTYTRSNKKWAVGCFHGTGDELVKKAYADSELSGNCYKAIVEAQEYVDRVLRR